MQRFRFKLYIHVFNMLSILFNVLLFILFNKIEQQNANYILILFALIAGLNFINNLFSVYIINEKSLILKSLVKRTEINWDEIECVFEQPAGKFVKLSFGVTAKNKKISITPWTKDYKMLLELVVNEVCKGENTKIDPRVLDVIRT